MNWLKKQWELFKSKSLIGKFWDVLFVLIILALIIPDGRMMFQRLVLKTGLMGKTTPNESIKIPSTDLSWKLATADGNLIQLSDFAGKPVFINFWATWCPPCRAEMPSIISLMQKVGSGAEFVFITYESPEKVETFLAEKGWELTVYYPQEEAPATLNAQSLPTTVVLNSNQQIIHRSEGMRNWDNPEALELLKP